MYALLNGIFTFGLNTLQRSMWMSRTFRMWISGKLSQMEKSYHCHKHWRKNVVVCDRTPLISLRADVPRPICLHSHSAPAVELLLSIYLPSTPSCAFVLKSVTSGDLIFQQNCKIAKKKIKNNNTRQFREAMCGPRGTTAEAFPVVLIWRLPRGCRADEWWSGRAV